MRIRSVPLFATALLGALAGTLVAGPAQAAGPVTYVALGDSYSSGVGAGGDDPAPGGCGSSPPPHTPPWGAAPTPAPVTPVARRGGAPPHRLAHQDGARAPAATTGPITHR